MSTNDPVASLHALLDDALGGFDSENDPFTPIEDVRHQLVSLVREVRCFLSHHPKSKDDCIILLRDIYTELADALPAAP